MKNKPAVSPLKSVSANSLNSDGSINSTASSGGDDKKSAKKKLTEVVPIEDRLLDLAEKAQEELELKRMKSKPRFKPKIFTKSYVIKDWDRYDMCVSDRLFEVAKENYAKELEKRSYVDNTSTLPPMESEYDRLVKYGLKMFDPLKNCFPNIAPNPDPTLAPATKRLLKSGRHLEERKSIRSEVKKVLKNGDIKIVKEEEPVENWLYHKYGEYTFKMEKAREDIHKQLLCKYKLPRYDRPEIPVFTIGENSEKIVRDKEEATPRWTHKFRIKQPLKHVKPQVLADIKKAEPTFHPKINPIDTRDKIVSDEDLAEFYYSITSSPDIINNCYILPNYTKSHSRTGNISSANVVTGSSSPSVNASFRTNSSVNVTRNVDLALGDGVNSSP